MIPDSINLKYQNFDNPFRKLFFDEHDFVGCDFSDYIPSWKMEASENFSQKLVETSIKFAEENKYYSFYLLISEKQCQDRMNKINQIKPEYLVSVEEEVLENEKPINLLFWDWIFENISYPEKMLVIYCFLPQEFRK
jgi:hypothetical protein